MERAIIKRKGIPVAFTASCGEYCDIPTLEGAILCKDSLGDIYGVLLVNSHASKIKEAFEAAANKYRNSDFEGVEPFCAIMEYFFPKDLRRHIVCMSRGIKTANY